MNGDKGQQYPDRLTPAAWAELGDRLARDVINDGIPAHSDPKIQMGILCAALALMPAAELSPFWIDPAQFQLLHELAEAARAAHESQHNPDFDKCGQLACRMARGVRFSL